MQLASTKLYTSVSLLSLLLSSAVFADVRFNGFASVRATAVDSDTGVSPFVINKGDGDISFKDDSLFALQASSDLGEGLSATVQFLAEGQNDFEVEAKWAYLSYELNDSHTLLAGKFVLPIFFQSQYEKVGYAHNFNKLPRAVYDSLDFTTIEGIGINGNYLVGDYTLETQVLYGNWEGTFQTESLGPLPGSTDNILSLNTTLRGDWWKVFVGGFVSEIGGEQFDQAFLAAFAPFYEAAAQTGATAAEIASVQEWAAIDGKDSLYWFTGFGIDYNNVLFDIEYVNYEIEDSADAENTAWYAALGYRFGQSVVTIHYEDYDQEGNPLVGVQNPSLAQVVSILNGAATDRVFDGYGISWRYDFHPSAAFKFEYTVGEDQRATIGDYSIISAGVDLIF